MLTETELIQEFQTLVERTYAETQGLLAQCKVKQVTAHWGYPSKRLDYLAIYCPDKLLTTLIAHKEAFRHISHYMGLAEPFVLSASRLLRDPMSKLKQDSPRFWLELHCLLEQE